MEEEEGREKSGEDEGGNEEEGEGVSSTWAGNLPDEPMAAAATSAPAHAASASTGSWSKSPTGGTELSTCVAPIRAAIPAGLSPTPSSGRHTCASTPEAASDARRSSSRQVPATRHPARASVRTSPREVYPSPKQNSAPPPTAALLGPTSWQGLTAAVGAASPSRRSSAPTMSASSTPVEELAPTRVAAPPRALGWAPERRGSVRRVAGAPKDEAAAAATENPIAPRCRLWFAERGGEPATQTASAPKSP
mmetsp:Transcript_35272/g.88184  ORF Transcript_35272/g.88184 Transcript_35272/m.88184 type:complete len:250 (+) Transcript_35272:1027-1776(+)